MTNRKAAMINEKIRLYVLEETFAEDGKVNNQTLIFKEGYFDSMGFVRLVSYLENEFGIKISDDDLVEQNFESINAISNFVSNRFK
jgi:acyl carrier protein